MQEEADCERRSPVGLFFCRHLPIRGSRGGGHILKVGDNRDGSAESTRLACVGSERTRKRDPKNAAELLGGTHRMGTTMQIADAIKPLNREREQGEKRVEEHTVFLMVASVFKTIAALGIVEPLVFNLPTTLRHVIQRQAAHLAEGDVGQPFGLDYLAVGFVLA